MECVTKFSSEVRKSIGVCAWPGRVFICAASSKPLIPARFTGSTTRLNGPEAISPSASAGSWETSVLKSASVSAWVSPWAMPTPGSRIKAFD